MEPTASPNEFIGLRRQGVFKINIDSEGCTATAPVAGLFTNPGPIEGRGNYLLSSSGKLVDSQTLSPIADLGASGFPAPCVDLTTSRAYLVSSTSIKAFALSDGSLAGEFVFPEPLSSSPSQALRWGSDGFALSFNDQVKIVRWTERPTGGN